MEDRFLEFIVDREEIGKNYCAVAVGRAFGFRDKKEKSVFENEWYFIEASYHETTKSAKFTCRCGDSAPFAAQTPLHQHSETKPVTQPVLS